MKIGLTLYASSVMARKIIFLNHSTEPRPPGGIPYNSFLNRHIPLSCTIGAKAR